MFWYFMVVVWLFIIVEVNRINFYLVIFFFLLGVYGIFLEFFIVFILILLFWCKNKMILM